MVASSTSPPTRRVTSIVELLSRARDPLSVSEIAGGLGLARATTTAVLTELVAAGWLRRDAELRYGIGDGLFELIPARSVGSTASPVLAELAHAAGAGVTLSRIEPDAMTVLAKQHAGPRAVPGFAVGQRIPLAFPAGASVMPWRPKPERTAWMASVPPSERRTARAILELAGERRIAAFRPHTDNAGLVDVLADLLAAVDSDVLRPDLRGRVLRQLGELTCRPCTAGELDGPDSLPLAYLAAPVVDAAGHAEYEVQLGPLRASVTGGERRHYVQELQRAATRLSELLTR